MSMGQPDWTNCSRDGAPGGDHLVQVLRGRTHSFELCLAATLLCRNVEAERLAVPRDGQRRAGFEVTCQLLSEFTDPDFERLHIVYSLYTKYHSSVPQRQPPLR